MKLLSVLLIGTLASSVTAAQDASKYYSVIHAGEFPIDFANDLYAAGDRRTTETRQLLPHRLDLAFGTDPKQRLDLYLPNQSASKMPVLLFLHGGGFSEGDRAHYGFIAAPYAEYGIITAIASYRLTTGGFTYPAPNLDAKAAVTWLYRNVAEYGGDPESIYVSGHSAGALLAADLGVNRSWLAEAGIPPSILKGIVLVSSGRYDLRAAQGVDHYVPTPKLKQQASPLLNIKQPVPSAVISYGSRSGYAPEDALAGPSQELGNRLRAQDVNVRIVELEGHDHIETVLSLGEPCSLLSESVLQLISADRTNMDQ